MKLLNHLASTFFSPETTQSLQSLNIEVLVDFLCRGQLPRGLQKPKVLNPKHRNSSNPIFCHHNKHVPQQGKDFIKNWPHIMEIIEDVQIQRQALSPGCHSQDNHDSKTFLEIQILLREEPGHSSSFRTIYLNVNPEISGEPFCIYEDKFKDSRISLPDAVVRSPTDFLPSDVSLSGRNFLDDFSRFLISLQPIASFLGQYRHMSLCPPGRENLQHCPLHHHQ